jgi:hypothetical protein
VIKWQSTVISQYNQSPTLQTLLYGINQWLDPTQNIDAFYKLIWNVDTAQGYGLDVWGRIVAVERTIANVETGDLYWGFGEASTLSAKPFDTSKVKLPQGGGIFYNGELFTSNVDLHDSDFRTLILAKAAFNICNGSIPAINQILMMLFGKAPKRGNAYVVDNQNMTMTYTFEFQPTPVEISIIQNTGVLPRPTGVQVLYRLNVPSGATRVFSAAAIIGGVSADFFAGMTRAPSLIYGVGAVRATARVRFAPLARMGGVGHVSADTSVNLARKQLGATLIGGIGHLSAISLPRFMAFAVKQFDGTASLRATASVIHKPQAQARFSGAGAIRVDTFLIHRPAASAEFDGEANLYAAGMRVVSAVARIGGSASMGAAAHVQTPYGVSAEIDGEASLSASVRLLRPAVARIAGVGGSRSAGLEGLPVGALIAGTGHVDIAIGTREAPAASEIDGVGRVRVSTAMRVVYGAARIDGESSYGDTAIEFFPVATRLAGLGSVRASGIHVVPAASEIDGEATLGAYGLRVVYATSRIAGVGASAYRVSFRLADADTRIAGAGGLRANASGNNVQSRISGVGGVRASSHSLTGAVLHGIGSMRANAIVLGNVGIWDTSIYDAGDVWG